MDLKAVENTRRNKTHLAQKLLTYIQCSGDSKSFAKETTALKIRTVMARHWKLTTTKWEDHRSWSPYNYTRSCQRTQRWPNSTVVRHLKQTGKVRKLDRWVPHELIENLKNYFEVSSSLILSSNNKPFLDRIVTCNEKWILYDNQW